MVSTGLGTTEPENDPNDPLDPLPGIIAPLILVVIVITALPVAIGCCCYHRRVRKRYLATLTEKRGVTILNNDLHHANQEGRLMVTVSPIGVMK